MSDIGDIETFVAGLGALLEAAPDRPLTADELAQLRAIIEGTRELRGLLAVQLADGDDAAVVRLLLGQAAEGQA